MANDNFKTHLLNLEGQNKARFIGEQFGRLQRELELIGVDGRYFALVSTKLEEACFFAKKAIAVKPENQMQQQPAPTPIAGSADLADFGRPQGGTDQAGRPHVHIDSGDSRSGR